MSFAWQDFFLHAYQLRHRSDEAAQRTAIGRAYYYVYNAALVSAQRRGFNPNAKVPGMKGGVHQRLWGWYANQSDMDFKDIAVIGRTLKDRRTEADYHAVPASPITAKAVQKQLDETREFELLLFQIEKTPPPPQP